MGDRDGRARNKVTHLDAEAMVHRRLLIMGCSQRKRSDPNPMPAIERYDGPRFRVLRKYLKQYPNHTLDVLILSARFGMIRSDRMIRSYDQLMTVERARELQPLVAAELGESFVATANARLGPEQVLMCMGKTYMGALDGVDEPTRTLLRSCVARGGQGQQLAQLKSWLYGEASPVNRPWVSGK
jgi:hypothetical protein